MGLEIKKPANKKPSAKGVPPVLEETPIVNLEVPSKSKLAQLPLAIDPEIKKDLKITSAEVGKPMVEILLEGYELWKEKYNRK